MIKADLHMHSVFSDGEKTPRELMEQAKKNGVQLLSVTDHDTVSQTESNQRTAKELGLYYLPGVEFTTYDEEQIHILGYRCDPTPEFTEKLGEILDQRARRNQEILRRLNAAGFPLSEEEIERNASGFFGTMHVIRTMIKKGYVKDYAEAMSRFFSTDGVAYVALHRITPKEAVRLIRGANGFPVLAHPGKIKGFDLKRQEILLKELVNEGLSGIESYYSSHTERETEAYVRLAEKYGLLSTVGSDYHGKTRPERIGTPDHALSDEEVAFLCGNSYPLS